MTLDQLRSFQAIVDGGSLKAASQTLHRTQPTISVAINLENELGIALFDRVGYRNELTPQGRALYEKAKVVLNEAGAFEQLAEQLGAGQEQEVGIAYTSAIPVGPIISRIRQCKIEYPRTRLEVYSENGMGPLDQLESGQASMVIIPWMQNHETLESIPFMKMRFVSVVAVGASVLQQYNVVPKEMIKTLPQVIISGRKSSTRNHGVLEGADQWRVNDFQAKKEIILQGMGWGSLPEHLIKQELEQGILVPIQVEGAVVPPELDIRIARVASASHGPVAARLWALFGE